MHKVTHLAICSLFALTPPFVLFGPAAAQDAKAPSVTVGFLLQPTDKPLVCSGIVPRACTDETAVVTGTVLESYYALLCIFGGDPETGIGGVKLGVDYDGASQSGVDIEAGSWTRCANGLEFPTDDWPRPRSGNIITWEPSEGCQRTVPGDEAHGVTAVVGFFSLTAYNTDRLSVIPHTQSPPGLLTFQVADCNTAQFDLDPAKQAGSVGFSSDGSEKGNLPCIRHVEEETTWGRIKSTYGN
jgi:hypothetical protein